MLIQIFKSRTIRQTAFVVGGTVLSAVVGSIFFIVSARILGPTNFGIFSFLTTILVLFTDIFDFGTNGGIIRFVSEALAKRNHVRSDQALKLSLKLKFTNGILLIFFGFFASPWIARQFLGNAGFSWWIFVTLVAVLPSLLFDFVSVALQAKQRFGAFITVMVTSNLVRLLLLFPMVFLFSPVLGSLGAIIIGLLTAVLFGFYYLSLDFWKTRGENELLPELFRFNRFVALSFIAATIASRVDIFFLTKFVSIADVGLYSAASKLAFIFPQIVAGLGTIFGPKFGNHTESQSARDFLNKTVIATSLLAIGVLLISWLSSPIIVLVLGSQYRESIPLFQTLLIGMSFLIVQVGPTSYINYYLGKPAVMAAYTLIQLVLVCGLNLFLIPRFGPMGSAITFAVAQCFMTILTLMTSIVYRYEQ